MKKSEYEGGMKRLMDWMLAMHNTYAQELPFDKDRPPILVVCIYPTDETTPGWATAKSFAKDEKVVDLMVGSVLYEETETGKQM